MACTGQRMCREAFVTDESLFCSFLLFFFLSVSNEGSKSNMHEVKMAILGTVQISDMIVSGIQKKQKTPKKWRDPPTLKYL